MYQKLINLMPPHDVFVSAFLGGGAVLRAKRPARLNVGIDRSGAVVEDYIAANVQTLMGVVKPDGGIDFVDDSGREFRLRVGDCVAWIRACSWSGSDFIYADPPYLKRTRSNPNRDLYEFEYTEADHVNLLALLLSLPCMVMVSGYWSDLYRDMLADWSCVGPWEARTRGGTVAHEYCWINYERPTVLHDYQYLGDDYRERERIKRKKERWRRRLAGMDALERGALVEVMREFE